MKHGYDKDALVKRLHRIEGQVRGIERMVDEDRYCIDILTQIAAVKTALEQVGAKLLEDHVTHCVRDAIASGAVTVELLPVIPLGTALGVHAGPGCVVVAVQELEPTV